MFPISQVTHMCFANPSPSVIATGRDSMTVEAIWHYRTSSALVLGNGLLLNSTKPLNQPMLTSSELSPIAFI